MRLTRLMLLVSLAFLTASSVRAEYIVLRNGQRLAVTGYQIVGDRYRLQMNSGFAEVPASDVIAIEPEEIFAPLPAVETVRDSREPFDELVQSASKRYSVDADLINSVIAAESNFDPKAVSRRNARGLMQLMPSTASFLGVHNVFDPRENIEGGTRYLRDLLQLYKNDLNLTLAAYNAGPQRVQFYGGRVPPFAETLSYVHRVKRKYAQRKSNVPQNRFVPHATSSASLETGAMIPVPSGAFAPKSGVKP